MASRITIYGKSGDPNTRRLQREMNTFYVEYDLRDPHKDDRARKHLADLGEAVQAAPLVEVQSARGDSSVFLQNPDEPTLRSCLYSEDILSITAYWV